MSTTGVSSSNLRGGLEPRSPSKSLCSSGFDLLKEYWPAQIYKVACAGMGYGVYSNQWQYTAGFAGSGLVAMYVLSHFFFGKETEMNPLGDTPTQNSVVTFFKHYWPAQVFKVACAGMGYGVYSNHWEYAAGFLGTGLVAMYGFSYVFSRNQNGAVIIPPDAQDYLDTNKENNEALASSKSLAQELEIASKLESDRLKKGKDLVRTVSGVFDVEEQKLKDLQQTALTENKKLDVLIKDAQENENRLEQIWTGVEKETLELSKARDKLEAAMRHMRNIQGDENV